MSEPVVLASRKCKPCEGGARPLSQDEIDALLRQLAGWVQRDGAISKTFRFPNFWQTMAFVNAIAWVAHREDHHPDLHVAYGTCRVDYRTHAIDGLSENDFICAAKVDQIPLA